MTRFYFRLESDGRAVIDRQGDTFCSLDEAIRHAEAVAAQLGHNDDCDAERLSLLDEAGAVVWHVQLAALTQKSVRRSA